LGQSRGQLFDPDMVLLDTDPLDLAASKPRFALTSAKFHGTSLVVDLPGSAANSHDEPKHECFAPTCPLCHNDSHRIRADPNMPPTDRCSLRRTDRTPPPGIHR
jgi:hypothetical protein